MHTLHLKSTQLKHPNRYYNIEFYKNLFDEYLVVRIIGSINNKTPTKVMKDIFSSYEDAVLFVESVVKRKAKHYKMLAIIK